jgi:hypothetical protein
LLALQSSALPKLTCVDIRPMSSTSYVSWFRFHLSRLILERHDFCHDRDPSGVGRRHPSTLRERVWGGRVLLRAFPCELFMLHIHSSHHLHRLTSPPRLPYPCRRHSSHHPRTHHDQKRILLRCIVGSKRREAGIEGTRRVKWEVRCRVGAGVLEGGFGRRKVGRWDGSEEQRTDRKR